MDVTEGDTTRMYHDWAVPRPKIVTPSADYEGETAQYGIMSIWHITSVGKFP